VCNLRKNADGCAHSWVLVGLIRCLLLVLLPRLLPHACQQRCCRAFGLHDGQAAACTTLQDAFSE